jgi:polyisoprenoid-binding protein YceI
MLVVLGACSAPANRPEQPMSSDDPSTRPATSLRHYSIDASTSTFTAEVEVGGLLSMFGHDHTVAMRDFTGDAAFDPDSLNGASLRVSIRAASIEEAGRDFSEEDRRKITREIHDKALEVSRYPEVLFQSTGLGLQEKGNGGFQIQLRGTLTLHGVSRPISFPVRLQLDGDRFTAEGRFTILHSDYGIERLSAAAGTVKAKDEIRLTFRLLGRPVK